MGIMRKQAGFSLMELMIAIVVVAIIASMAIPSYRDSVRRANRSAAQQFLMDVANRQGQSLMEIRQYQTDTCANVDTALTALGLAVPSELDSIYDFCVTANNGVAPPTFSITADPKGAQNEGKEAGKTLGIDHQGNQTPAGMWEN